MLFEYFDLLSMKRVDKRDTISISPRHVCRSAPVATLGIQDMAFYVRAGLLCPLKYTVGYQYAYLLRCISVKHSEVILVPTAHDIVL